MSAILAHDADLPYSLDEDFKEFTDKDRMVELVGYICNVNAATQVGSTTKYHLLKFGLSNGGTQKVQILIWGTPLIELHQPHIQINRKIHIDGGQCKATRVPHTLEAQGYVPFEICIQPHTVVRYLGMHEEPTEHSVQEKPVDVTFETINQETDRQGLISINGYIKTKFTSVASRFENASYGSGCITDGLYKLIVNIRNFVPVDLEKGAAVTVIGTVDANNGPLVVNCLNMNAISRRENVPSLTEAALVRGVRTIKRRIDAA